MQMSSVTNCSWQLDRQGNCLWKHRFPRQWNWLSTERKKKCSHGKEICCTKKKKKKGSTGFSSAPNTRKTHGAHSHVAITRLGRIIVNTVTCCYSRRLATGLNAVILTCFCAMFQLRKSECYKSFESKCSGGEARFQSFSFKSVPMPD